MPASLPVPAVVGPDEAGPAAEHLLGADDIAQGLPAARQNRDELGEVHGAAATEADHAVGPDLVRERQNGIEVREVRLGFTVPNTVISPERPSRSTRPALKSIGDYERAAVAALGEEARDAGQGTRAEGDLLRPDEIYR